MRLSAIVTVPAGLDPADFTVPIAGVPALVRSVLALIDVAPVSVLAPEGSVDAAVACLDGFGLAVPVAKLIGPQRFSHSVLDGQRPGDAVLLHDVRYPLASAELAARVAAAAPRWDVVLPVLAVTDSVKTVAAHGIVLGNVDRSELVGAQYPRSCTVAALTGVRDAGIDDVLAVPGLRVGTVEGEPNAFVVDLGKDRDLLEAIVAAGCGGG